MGRSGALVPAVVGLLIALLAPAASANTSFHPRVGPALGLLPPVAGPHKLTANATYTLPLSQDIGTVSFGATS